MKKTYLIIGGVSAILILLAIWVYLLIYGTPKPIENFFTDFSFTGESTSDSPLIDTPLVESPQIDVVTAKLRQLTTKPVIGFREISDAESSDRELYYAEAGTGYIYKINLVTGEETRISGTTLPNASKAAFDQNGQYVAVATGYTNPSSVTLLTLGNTDNSSARALSQKIVDFSFSSASQLLYTEYTSSGQSGRTLNPETSIVGTIFNVPFQSANIIWSTSPSIPHYVYPKSSSELTGYLYSLQGGGLKRLPESGLGLTALTNADYIITTKITGTTPQSRALNLNTNKDTGIPVVADPNKCVLSGLNTNQMYCGNDLTNYGNDFPDDWYKGTRSFNDRLFLVDLDRGSATQLISPEATLGRTVDVINMSISPDGRVLYFINKNDNTLWMYEI